MVTSNRAYCCHLLYLFDGPSQVGVDKARWYLDDIARLSDKVM